MDLIKMMRSMISRRPKIGADYRGQILRARGLTEDDIDLRWVSMRELRAEPIGDDGRMIIHGYPVVYNQRTDLGWFEETIAEGALTDALRNTNHFLLWQHDPAQPLANHETKTLTTREDEHGVYFEAEVIDTQWGRDAYKSVSAGLVRGGSFGFFIDENDEKWELENGVLHRIVKRAQSFELSVVTFPAYEGTSVSARSIERAKAEKQRGSPAASDDSIRTQLAMQLQYRERRRELLDRRQMGGNHARPGARVSR